MPPKITNTINSLGEHIGYSSGGGRGGPLTGGVSESVTKGARRAWRRRPSTGKDLASPVRPTIVCYYIARLVGARASSAFSIVLKNPALCHNNISSQKDRRRVRHPGHRPGAVRLIPPHLVVLGPHRVEVPRRPFRGRRREQGRLRPQSASGSGRAHQGELLLQQVLHLDAERPLLLEPLHVCRGDSEKGNRR